MRHLSVNTVLATVVVLILAVVPLGKRVYECSSTVDYPALYLLDCHHMARSCKNVLEITMIKKFDVILKDYFSYATSFLTQEVFICEELNELF